MYYQNFEFKQKDAKAFIDLDALSQRIEHAFVNAQLNAFDHTAIDINASPFKLSVLCGETVNLIEHPALVAALSDIGFELTKRIAFEKVSTSKRSEISCSHGHTCGHHEHDHSHESHSHERKHGEHHHHHAHEHHDHKHEHKKQSSEDSHAHHHSHHHHDHEDSHWLNASIGLTWGVALLILSLSGFSLPLLAYNVITGLTATMTLYLGREVYQSAWQSLLNGKLDTNTLYSISTLTILAVSVASMFVPGMPMMFEAAPFVLGFWHLGEAIEHSLLSKINTNLDIRDCVAPTVTLKNGKNKIVFVKSLIPNDIIALADSAVVPVDGVLLEKAWLYTTRVDGSPYPKLFKAGAEVKSGMQLVKTGVDMRVTKLYQQSYLSLIAKNIDKANSEKAPIEVFANQVLKYFVPGLIAVAATSGVALSLLFSPAIAIESVISILVSACPCALSLITPLAVQIGMKRTAERGIHFSDGKALQSASDIDTVVFDLNGTMTTGDIKVKSFYISDEKYLPYVALLEKQSAHPVAKVIADYIDSQTCKLVKSLSLTDYDDSHHAGIKGMINSNQFMVGNKKMLSQNGIVSLEKPYDDPNNGAIYIVHGKQVIGQIGVVDPLRKDAIRTVQQLKALGKNVHICTGADETTVKQYIAKLGIPKENVCANTVGVSDKTGEFSKADYIQQLQQQGHKVAMVGDAANDASAIAHADVGVAVKSAIGDSVTEKYAGIVLQKGLLFPIAEAFDIAKMTKRNILQNLFVSLTYNGSITLLASGLFVGLGLTINPIAGVALMVLESTIVFSNLYRFKHQQTLADLPENTPAALVEENGVETTSTLLSSLNYQPAVEKQTTVAVALDQVLASLSKPSSVKPALAIPDSAQFSI